MNIFCTRVVDSVLSSHRDGGRVKAERAGRRPKFRMLKRGFKKSLELRCSSDLLTPCIHLLDRFVDDLEKFESCPLRDPWSFENFNVHLTHPLQ